MQSLRSEKSHSNHLRQIRRLAGSLLLKLPCVLLVAAAADAHAGGLVRVSDGHQSYEGKVLGLNRATCSLLDREGQIVHLDVGSLQDFRKLGQRYVPYASSQFRDSLRKEFPGEYEVSGTTHYLVCGPAGRARRYADLFESIYRDVEQFYRVRGFETQSPDVPLVAIVFRSQKEFVDYCGRDQVQATDGLMGYYSLKTNRVALFDDDQLLSSRGPDSSADQWQRTLAGSMGRDLRQHRAAAKTALLPDAAQQQWIAAATAISGETASTIIHETTHQVGYNIGIHSRLGGTPVWVVEGLATVLEPAGMRSTRGRNLVENRINDERINWFRKQHRPDRATGNLARLVASDDYFHQHTLDSYSESWAFTFFLLENPSRRKDFVSYLQKLAQRDSGQPYSGRQRIEDFQSAFGDIRRLEIEFIRFMDRM